MSNQRRRAHDFTDSLSSFRLTISKGEIIPRASSENRLNDMRNTQGEAEKYSRSRNKSRDSIILAGSLASQRCSSLSDLCNTAQESYNATYDNKQPQSMDTLDSTSYLSIKPDLNKCINLFHNEHLIKEYDTLEKQLNTTLPETSANINIRHLSNMAEEQQSFNKRQRSVSIDSLENTVLLGQELTRSKSYTTFDRILNRDTNHNIKADQLSSKIVTSCSENVEKIIPSFNALKLSQSSALPRRKDDSYLAEDERHDSTSSETSSKEELDPLELRTFLHSLADEKPLKEATVQQRLLRRLSANCYDSPKGFTEGLLTIIEESIINDSLQYPEVSVYRFNEELRRMCKFIEDETIPEWPQSPGMSTSIYARRKSQECKSNVSWKSLFPGTPLNNNKTLCSTPISPRRNIRSPKKICRRKSKNTSTLLLDSTNNFEHLEAYCETLYPEESRSLSGRKDSQSQSSSRSMEDIRRAYESQMASLEDSFNIQEEIRKAGTCTSVNQHLNKTPKTQNLQHRLVSNEKYDKTKSKKDTFNQRTQRSKHREIIELESSLMYEIAKERQRCIDTAKIMEINENSESVEDIHPKIVISKSSPTTNDDKFKKILMCVKKYQDYLEERRPILNLLHGAKLNSPRTPRDGKDIRAKKSKKMSNENLDSCSSILLGNKSLRTPKRSPGKKSISPSSAKHRPTKTFVSKPRLFMTPGKTPVKGCRPKRQYFPTLLPNLNKQDESTMKKIYRQMENYDHVVSPVGMYIKGKKPYLKKNLQSKTDEEVFTSERKQTQSPSPRIMKFRPSPRQTEKVTGTTIGDEKVADNGSKNEKWEIVYLNELLR
ncbi:uncharacterized protein LOC112452160 isoform X1 [Temnothorax curvispinosus]|uniref:Uncharacterized protein LOC112452160 isoform X1 n=1 Tax=Temnothorax curvispinosus TaxID=300111 RepID=A0A6J1PEP5_9HYME|nr:uncharacterized protein LOC112452160 isoform X1 [Temnothorax curvispinosus]XP_024868008.1 uncharacterized protein LOC112452160 isoform X1 [Temnothorax curvispinosus]XP_024868009.1 uncharacterized protein LOC112452160 isoform X1 [Temnothorax curvispinosus]